MDIQQPRMYNTGFIKPNTDDIRLNQGLQAQNLANACIINEKPTTMENMYPYYFPYANYGPGTPSDSCPCLIWTRPP